MKRKLVGIVLALGCAVALMFQATAQPPEKKGAEEPGKKKKSKEVGSSSLVARMMAFDKNKDGKLTRDEVTDRRLLRLFDRADKNKDGVVTREELEALAAELEAEIGPGGRGPGGKGKGKGGKGGPPEDDEGPGGPGKGGPGGKGKWGGPPRPGQVLPEFLQERLNLTAAQKKDLAALQKDVDARLAKILTAEQKEQLAEMRDRFKGGPKGKGKKGKGGPDDD